MKFLYITSLVLLTCNAAGQNADRDRRDIIKTIDSSAYNKFKSSFPITRDTLNKYPDSTVIEGNLIDYTIGVSCGVFCGCGTLKIKVTNPNKQYAQKYIYVAVPCLNVLPKQFKKKSTWTLFKIPIQDKSCFWRELPMNKFDTNGLPFYTLIKYNDTQ